MKYFLNLICLLIAQKTYGLYLCLCTETLSRDYDHDTLIKKIKGRVKIFKVFLDATRLSPRATGIDKTNERAKLKEVEDDIFSKYCDDKISENART